VSCIGHATMPQSPDHSYLAGHRQIARSQRAVGADVQDVDRLLASSMRYRTRHSPRRARGVGHLDKASVKRARPWQGGNDVALESG
jgi:hypothetical protein